MICTLENVSKEERMEMLKKYLEELNNGRGVVYNDRGFATFEITGDECYIVDIYIEPEYRTAKEASKLADEVVEIALERGCSILTGSVVPSAHNSTISLKVLLGYGFELHGASDNFITFAKELKRNPNNIKGALNE